VSHDLPGPVMAPAPPPVTRSPPRARPGAPPEPWRLPWSS